MPPIAIVLIAVLAAHYFLAIATLFVLLRDRGVTKAIIPWNLIILLIPICGPAAYWIARTIKKNVPAPQSGDAEPSENIPDDTNPPADEENPPDDEPEDGHGTQE